MTFFMLAYLMIWLLLFGYVAVLHKQQKELRKQVMILEEMLENSRPQS